MTTSDAFTISSLATRDDGRHPGDHLGNPHHIGPSLRQAVPHDGASRRKRPRRRNCNLKLDGYRTRRPDQPCNGQQSQASHCNQYLDRTRGSFLPLA